VASKRSGSLRNPCPSKGVQDSHTRLISSSKKTIPGTSDLYSSAYRFKTEKTLKTLGGPGLIIVGAFRGSDLTIMCSLKRWGKSGKEEEEGDSRKYRPGVASWKFAIQKRHRGGGRIGLKRNFTGNSSRASSEGRRAPERGDTGKLGNHTLISNEEQQREDSEHRELDLSHANRIFV